MASPPVTRVICDELPPFFHLFLAGAGLAAAGGRMPKRAFVALCDSKPEFVYSFYPIKCCPWVALCIPEANRPTIEKFWVSLWRS